MSQFLHHHHKDDNDDTKAITIPWVFSENSRAKNLKSTILFENLVTAMLNRDTIKPLFQLAAKLQILIHKS